MVVSPVRNEKSEARGLNYEQPFRISNWRYNTRLNIGSAICGQCFTK